MGIKIKITAKFLAFRRLRFEDTKRIMSPEMCPKSFGTFEKQAPGPSHWVKQHGDPKVLIPLNPGLALTMLQTTRPKSEG